MKTGFWLACLLLVWTTAAGAQPPETLWASYHDYARMTETLKRWEKEYPDLLKITSLGKSVQGRDLWLVTISGGDRRADKPAVLFDGCIHGSELIGTESLLAYIQFLVTQYPTDRTTRRIVDGWTTYLIPMVNPDGVEAGKTATKGKTARKNAHGVDLNRNFDWNWNDTAEKADLTHPTSWEYHGPKPFSEPETRALRDFVLSHPILMYVNCHAGTGSIPHLITEFASSDSARFNAICREIEMRATFQHRRGKLVGEAGHWVYWKGMQATRSLGAHPLAFALEIYTNPDSSITLDAPNWWERYLPPDNERETWLHRVQTTLLLLTQYTTQISHANSSYK